MRRKALRSLEVRRIQVLEEKEEEKEQKDRHETKSIWKKVYLWSVREEVETYINLVKESR